jgi:hypothetical protein
MRYPAQECIYQWLADSGGAVSLIGMELLLLIPSIVNVVVTVRPRTLVLYFMNDELDSGYVFQCLCTKIRVSVL